MSLQATFEYTCHSNTGLSPQNGESKEIHVHVTRVAKFIQPTWTPAEFYVNL